MPPDLLFLCHRIPYPPDKGDKIRAFHILKHLRKSFKVHMGCFVDDPADEAYIPALRAEVETLACIRLQPSLAKLKAITRWRPGKALSVAYYQNQELREWVCNIAKTRILKQIFVFSSTMAPYADLVSDVPKLLDMVDVDSEKFSAYGQNSRFPFNLIWTRESKKLLKFERATVGRFDRTIFVSDAEASRFNTLAPERSGHTDWVGNGVDFSYFSPTLPFATPFDSRPAIVFTGAMDYRPNIEAALWFAKKVMPALVLRQPVPVFYIVGSNPPPVIKALSAQKSIVVTGKVPDTRPYLAHASIAVAPLQIARGIQNKVLEAMSMARPVIASPEAFLGLNATPGYDLLVARSATEMIRFIDEVLDGKYSHLGQNARTTICETYSWQTALSRLDNILIKPRLKAPIQ
jgi:sugar transferase (PEP-CTERM/EpsH1 system associated)